MRYMLMLKGNPDSESGKMPSAELIAEMGRFNEELIKAGVLLAGDGLTPSSMGARVMLSAHRRTVIDGPFAEAKELIAGYWMIQAKSKEEAIEWAKRAPNPAGDGDAVIEVRRLWDTEDFAPAVEGSAEGRAALEKEKEFRKTSST
ncbi:MAG: YciI family protein [Gemmatimonadetes bacterium]|nr:YciI family protein [Gemmatimonadota bacterium]